MICDMAGTLSALTSDMTNALKIAALLLAFGFAKAEATKVVHHEQAKFAALQNYNK